MFLFSDSIIIGEMTKRNNSGTYEALEIGTSLKDVRIQHCPEDDNTFQLTLQKNGRVHFLQSSNSTEKSEWMDAISLAVSEHMMSPSSEWRDIVQE